MIVLLIAFLLADLLSIAFPFVAYYLFREWQRYNDTLHDAYADRCLYGLIAMLAMMLLGRFLIKALLSQRRKGEDEPHLFKAAKKDTLRRPDGAHINIEYYGKEQGQPIIFVHGLNANNKNWYYQKAHFEKDYRLIMMDLPGMGGSTRPANKDFSMENLASHLSAVIEHTGTRNPILWGHSMGGMTILTLVAKLRSSLNTPIKGLILEHTTFTNPVKTMLAAKLMTAIQKPVLVPFCWVLIVLSPLIWISRWMSYLNGNSHIATRFLTFAGTQTPKQLDYTTLLSTMAPPAITARGALSMFRYDVTAQLPSIDVPTLVIAAHKDRLTKPFASEYMAAHIPKAKLVVMAPGNHQALIERHAEVNAAADEFISSL